MTGRLSVVAIVLAAAVVAAAAWFTGSGSFDFMDGTEFAVCGGNLELPHPPGYPLFIFFLRASSIAFPFARPDYSFFRAFVALVSGAGVTAAFAAARSIGSSRSGAIAGAVLLFTLGPVLARMNVVEVHGFAMLLVLAAIALRESRAGPYVYSLSIFGGHPLSILMAPVSLSRRHLGKWGLTAAIPFSLMLFVPIRSAFGALCHYSSPADVQAVWKYFTLYGPRISLPSPVGMESLYLATGPLSTSILLILILLSRRWRWKLFLSASAGLLFISCYSIPDIESIAWVVLLPLALWAAAGFSRLMNGGIAGIAAAVVMLFISMVSGVSLASRGGDDVASVIARDYLRGAGFRAAFVAVGVSAFHTAYLLEVEDRRPDILPMDYFGNFFRMPAPAVLSDTLYGRKVFATRGWRQENLRLRGLLFTSEDTQLNWNDFDIYSYQGGILEAAAADETAELWARRAIQTLDDSLRAVCEEKALQHVRSGIAERRIRRILDRDR